MRRNRITPKRAEDLVFVHSNLRLLSRRRLEYTIGESNKWDIGGDNWDEPFEGPRLFEIAYLTLDEPKMKTVLLRIMTMLMTMMLLFCDNLESLKLVILLCF